MRTIGRSILGLLRVLGALVALPVPIGAQPPYGHADAGAHDRAAAMEAFPKRPYSPSAGRNDATQSFLGHTHRHAGFSMDAGAFGRGSKRVTPAGLPQ